MCQLEVEKYFLLRLDVKEMKNQLSNVQIINLNPMNVAMETMLASHVILH